MGECVTLYIFVYDASALVFREMFFCSFKMLSMLFSLHAHHKNRGGAAIQKSYKDREWLTDQKAYKLCISSIA